MRFIWLVLCLLSSQIFAQSVPLSTALSLTPPPTDTSIIFLGNLFGVVDGVLSGNGSQIFGHMMQVFNAAILGLGSIIIMYTLIVGTLNTAQEGEFLGRQWSSVWIPVRCTTGLALLVPKATGYSLIQIFVLWVIVQGVGAGDKIWNAALEYLNMGGKVVQVQQSTRQMISTDSGSDNSNDVLFGAGNILAGQVCMLGLQKIVELAQKDWIEKGQQAGSTSPCSGTPVNDENRGNTVIKWSQFCSGTIPDFLATIDFSAAEKAGADGVRTLPMPNFDSTSFLYSLNGICGTIKWNPVKNVDEYQSDWKLNKEDTDALSNSRMIAIQTMFSNLSMLATAMVANNATLSPQLNLSTQQIPQFGVALNSEGQECGSLSQNCKDWGALPGNDSSVLFSGSEFSNALGAYTGLMMPVLNLAYQHSQKKFYKNAKSFIDETERTGWIFAGAYFFKVVNLSGSPQSQPNTRDTDSGLDQVVSVNRNIVSSGDLSGSNTIYTNYASLIETQLPFLFYNNSYSAGCNTNLLALTNLLGMSDMSLQNSFDSVNGYVSNYSSKYENTVLGFIRNSTILNIGEQVGSGGVKGIKFPSFFSVLPKPLTMPGLHGCFGKVKILGFKLCLGNVFIYPLYTLVKVIIDFISIVIYMFIWVVLQILIVVPMMAIIVPLINTAFKVINNMSLSPIVDLANLGAMFIQNTLYGYLAMLGVTMLVAAIPFSAFGKVVELMLAFMMPFYTAWLTYFLSIGFTTAFYIPLVPYMIYIFGVVAWFFLVIEAVLAGPLVALLMTSPEGEGLLGNKGEQGLILLVNLFLRPSLMVIGFVTGIALTYVNIWALNASYSIAADYIRSPVDTSDEAKKYFKSYDMSSKKSSTPAPVSQEIDWAKYPFASLMGMMFYLVLYVSLYTTMVQKAFQLIALLPDKVIRWVGGSESAGQEAAGWEREVSQKFDKAADAGAKGLEGGMAKAMEKTAEIKEEVEEKAEQGAAAGAGAPP